MFFDPRFSDLGIRHVRLVVPWDVLNVRWQRQELDQWLHHARRTRAQPLIAFTHSRRTGARRVLPSVDHWSRRFAQLPPPLPVGPRLRDVERGQPLRRADVPPGQARRPLLAGDAPPLPARAGSSPPSCSTSRTWSRGCASSAPRAGVDPEYWGLHNYRDANRMQTTQHAAAAARDPRQDLAHGDRRHRQPPQQEHGRLPASRRRHAARATRWVFDKLVPLSPRIERVYLYHWNASSPTRHLGLRADRPRQRRARPRSRVLRRVLQRGRAPARARRREARDHLRHAPARAARAGCRTRASSACARPT